MKAFLDDKTFKPGLQHFKGTDEVVGRNRALAGGAGDDRGERRVEHDSQAVPRARGARVAARARRRSRSRARPRSRATRSSRRRRQNWPTNGGNWYNQRYSPLTEIDRDNVAHAQRRVAHAAARLGRRHAVLGRSAAARLSTASSTSSRAPTTCSRSASTAARSSGRTRANLDAANDVVCCGWTSRGVGLGDGKVFVGQLDGKLVALDQRTGKVAWSVQAERWQDGLHDHERSALLRRPRRSRASRAPSTACAAASKRSTRSNGKLVVDVLHDPRPRRSRPRHVAAGQRALAARRRTGLAHAGRRSRARTHLLLDRQSRARLQRRRARRRQPVLGVDRRASTRRRASTAGTSSRCITTSGTTTARAPSCCSISS